MLLRNKKRVVCTSGSKPQKQKQAISVRSKAGKSTNSSVQIPTERGDGVKSDPSRTALLQDNMSTEELSKVLAEQNQALLHHLAKTKCRTKFSVFRPVFKI